jgi:hypothetical protein
MSRGGMMRSPEAPDAEDDGSLVFGRPYCRLESRGKERLCTR